MTLTYPEQFAMAVENRDPITQGPATEAEVNAFKRGALKIDGLHVS